MKWRPLVYFQDFYIMLHFDTILNGARVVLTLQPHLILDKGDLEVIERWWPAVPYYVHLRKLIEHEKEHMHKYVSDVFILYYLRRIP